MKIEFRFTPADDAVDAGHDLYVDGVETGFSIQDAPYMGAAQRFGVGHFDGSAMSDHGSFASLEAAKAEALRLFRTRH